VDCFDALASERPYRKAMPLDEAMAFVKSRAGIQFDPRIVELLAEHYLELEEKAREQIEEIAPLKTDLSIQRGAAPGAGFEPEHSTSEAMAQVETVQAAVAVAGQTEQQPATWTPMGSESREAQAVFELNQELGSPRSARDTGSIVSSRLRTFIPFDCFAVYLKSGRSLSTQLIDSAGFEAFSMLRIPVGAGLSGWVAEHARPIVNGNPTVEPNYLSQSGLLTAASSALSIPLFDPSGAVFAVLTLYSAASAAFSKDHLRILQAIEPRFSLALQNAFRVGDAEAGAAIPPALESLAAR
jgi:GAF domain-containing protein